MSATGIIFIIITAGVAIFIAVSAYKFVKSTPKTPPQDKK